MNLQRMYAQADSASYYSHTGTPDDIWEAIDNGGLRVYLWIKKELRNYFIKWDTTTIQTTPSQDEYACPPDLATMIRFGERLPGEANYRRLMPVDPRSDVFAAKQYEPIIISFEMLTSDFSYIGPYLPRNAGPQAIVCMDSNGKYWQFGVSDAGFPTSIPLFGSALPPITPLYLNDPGNTTTWQLVVSTAGAFSWSSVGFNAAFKVSPLIMATLPNNKQVGVSVSAAGVQTISRPSDAKGAYKVRLAPTPQDARQTELIYDAKYLPIVNQDSYNVIPEEGHKAQLDFAKAELLRGNNDDLADKYETIAMQKLTEFLTYVRERQIQLMATQEPYIGDLD